MKLVDVTCPCGYTCLCSRPALYGGSAQYPKECPACGKKFLKEISQSDWD